MVADHTAQMGILGAAGAIKVPMIERAMEADLGRDPAIKAMQEKLQFTSDPAMKKHIAEEIQEEKTKLLETIYKPKWRAILDAQNTPQRAHHVGSIHHLIQETGQSRRILHKILTDKMAELEGKDRENQKRAQDRIALQGWANLLGIRLTLVGEDKVLFEKSRLEVSMEHALSGLRKTYQDSEASAVQNILGEFYRGQDKKEEPKK
jgi:hypothetical protein